MKFSERMCSTSSVTRIHHCFCSYWAQHLRFEPRLANQHTKYHYTMLWIEGAESPSKSPNPAGDASRGRPSTDRSSTYLTPYPKRWGRSKSICDAPSTSLSSPSTFANISVSIKTRFRQVPIWLSATHSPRDAVWTTTVLQNLAYWLNRCLSTLSEICLMAPIPFQ